MKLQTKISLAILPMMAAVIFAFGTWTVITSTQGIHDALYQVVLKELQDYVEHSLSDYHQTLVKHDIAGVQSFVESYKKMAFSDADKLHYFKTGHLNIFNTDGEQLYCSRGHKDEISGWRPVLELIRNSAETYVQGRMIQDSESEIYIGHRFVPWGWTIVYAISDEELMAPLWKIQKATFVTAIICIFVGFVLIFFVQKYYIIGPVTKLMKATGSVAALKQVERIDIPSRDELGSLARSMESMAHAIHAHRMEKDQWQEHLESQIEKRTAELQDSNQSLKWEIQLREKIYSQLSENELFLRVVLNSIQDGICVLDTELNIVRVNKAMEQLYPDKVPLEGKKCYEAFRNRTEHCTTCPSLAALNSGEMKMEEVNYATEGGESGLLEVFAFPMQAEGGSVTGVVEYVRDITERVIARRELELSEERFRAIFESTTDCIIVWDRQYDYLYANQAAIDQVGTTRDNVIGKNIRDGLGHIPDFMKLWMDRIDLVFASGEPIRVEDDTPVNEQIVYSESILSPIKDTDGNIFAVGVVYRDVTKQKMMLQEISEAHELNERITSSPSLGIAVYEKSGQCVFVNNALATLIGSNRDDCMLQNFNSLNSWKKSGLAEKANNVLADGSERDHQIHVVSSFGREVWLNCKLTRFYKNNLPHLLLFIEDVSEKTRMHAQLEERNRALELSNKELDDFAYIASHDLKEPLRGIANYSTFLMEDYVTVLDGDGKSKLETLVKLCKREESLIESLLYYSRVGRTELAIEPVDLNLAVQDVIDRILPSFSGISVDISIRDSLPTLECDRVRVGEVFYNLVVNGIKYNDDDNKRVEIGVLDDDECKNCTALNSHLSDCEQPVFFVRDNGIGIRKKHIGKIFGIFKRLHGRDKYGGGTGAGLTIVEKIIKRHGGTICVETEVGKGSTFYFTLKGKKS